MLQRTPMRALPYEMDPSPDVRRELLGLLANAWIQHVLELCPEVSEGAVMSIGPAPYRRLDCDGLALAYIRPRPRRSAVRVDFSGLWRVTRPSRLLVPHSAGAATLMLASAEQIPEATRLVRQIVEDTRRARAQESSVTPALNTYRGGVKLTPERGRDGRPLDGVRRGRAMSRATMVAEGQGRTGLEPDS
jgi:hypothetical protein